ncbi:hypothetical protein GCM10010521_35730 [Streptomyces rameus]|uniref:Uncharacterized protein n=1 Tax=Streptomyces rameus TaxID=68261 RepID=A0ABP6NG84_9ACTN
MGRKRPETKAKAAHSRSEDGPGPRRTGRRRGTAGGDGARALKRQRPTAGAKTPRGRDSGSPQSAARSPGRGGPQPR